MKEGAVIPINYSRMLIAYRLMRGSEGPSLEIYFIFGDQKYFLRLFENLKTNMKTSILFITVLTFGSPGLW